MDEFEDLENALDEIIKKCIGLPESYKPNLLINMCTKQISEDLGITKTCIVERAHRMGIQHEERTSPRPVIVRFLNYTEKIAIL